MKLKLFTKDKFMLLFTGLIVLAFFVAGIFDILDYFIVKFVLFVCFSFVVANIYYVLFKEKNKKSPETDSE